jgi:hypothetical protein
MLLRQAEVTQGYLIEVQIHRTLHSYHMGQIQLKMLREKIKRKS